MSYLSINEIRDTVRLIDMGFYPLFKEMAKEVKAINIHSEELFNTVVKGDSEQSIDVATKLDINSAEDYMFEITKKVTELEAKLKNCESFTKSQI